MAIGCSLDPPQRGNVQEPLVDCVDGVLVHMVSDQVYDVLNVALMRLVQGVRPDEPVAVGPSKARSRALHPKRYIMWH